MAEFRMPSLGADMDAGVLVEWLVRPGDRVKRGDIVAVVETQKGAIDVEIFDEGYVQELVVPVGVKVPVDAILAVIGPAPPAAGGRRAAPARAAAAPATVAAEPQVTPTPAPPDAPAGPAIVPPEPAIPPPEPPGGAATRPGIAPSPPTILAPEPPAITPPEAAAITPPEAAAITTPEAAAITTPEAAAITPASPPAMATPAAAAIPTPSPPAAPAAGEAAPMAPAGSGAKPRIAPILAAPDGVPLRVSPRARRLAGELGVDLGRVAATGPAGSIIGDDVLAAARAAPPAAPAPARPGRGAGTEAQAAMREAIQAAMSRSKREIPHYYLLHQVDVSAALTWLKGQNASLPVQERLLPIVVVLQAIARALRGFPELNGLHVDGARRPSDAIHLGVAVALRGGGLVAPAIHDADRLGLGALMARLRDLVARARGGGLRSSELRDPTITVTSLGDRGVDAVLPVIYPPQVAIVGVGTIAERPWVVDGAVVPRSIVTLSLAADHRVSDGHRGALFLEAVARRLQEPPEP